MSTIDELMEGKKPGEIKICRSIDRTKYFIPFFRDSIKQWNGLGPAGEFKCEMAKASSLNWELYQEPKPKVKRWLWVNGKYVFPYMKSEEEVKMHECYHKSWQKLPFSETEFEE